MRSYFAFWLRYVDFSGKTSRKAFVVSHVLFCVFGFLWALLIPVFSIIIFHITPDTALKLCYAITALRGLAWLTPALAMTTRRLHDAGYDARTYFWLLVPVIGGVAFLARLLGKSVPSESVTLSED